MQCYIIYVAFVIIILILDNEWYEFHCVLCGISCYDSLKGMLGQHLQPVV
jgi:hypothetical protein